jgi:hypothetical protein
MTKLCSKSDEDKEENIKLLHDEMDYRNIARYVACDCDYTGWVGCVFSTEEEEETDTMKIMFLHHNGPSPS